VAFGGKHLPPQQRAVSLQQWRQAWVGGDWLPGSCLQPTAISKGSYCFWFFFLFGFFFFCFFLIL
jgi:hypothetical protein